MGAPFCVVFHILQLRKYKKTKKKSWIMTQGREHGLSRVHCNVDGNGYCFPMSFCLQVDIKMWKYYCWWRFVKNRNWSAVILFRFARQIQSKQPNLDSFTGWLLFCSVLFLRLVNRTVSVWGIWLELGCAPSIAQHHCLKCRVQRSAAREINSRSCHSPCVSCWMPGNQLPEAN